MGRPRDRKHTRTDDEVKEAGRRRLAVLFLARNVATVPVLAIAHHPAGRGTLMRASAACAYRVFLGGA